MGIVKAESNDAHKVKHSGLYGFYIEILSVINIESSFAKVHTISNKI